MTEDSIPYNKVGTSTPEGAAGAAEREGISEEEWRSLNLPAEKLEFRWRYDNKVIPLYERRLRSLGSFNVGPAVQAWVRSRLEWVRDNKLYERPNGVIVLTIDPEGIVDITLEDQGDVPAFEEAHGTRWSSDGDMLRAHGPIREAADTLTRDLAQTLGYTVVEGARSDAGEASFVVNDEYGIIARAQADSPAVKKLAECFDKLWSQGK